jgi:DNA-binding response OmpR family regulator
MPSDVTLEGRRILTVEDDYLIAQSLVDFLEDAGARVAGPIGQLDEAMAFIEKDAERLDGVVLDINLHGKKSYPVADALISRSIGFIFTTGYAAGVIEGNYAQYPRCEKPFNRNAVVAALANLKNNNPIGAPQASEPSP